MKYRRLTPQNTGYHKYHIVLNYSRLESNPILVVRGRYREREYWNSWVLAICGTHSKKIILWNVAHYLIILNESLCSFSRLHCSPTTADHASLFMYYNYDGHESCAHCCFIVCSVLVYSYINFTCTISYHQNSPLVSLIINGVWSTNHYRSHVAN